MKTTSHQTLVYDLRELIAALEAVAAIVRENA
jgi:hypothetical protein